jgi:uncharacterized protein (DUF1330 family)
MAAYVIADVHVRDTARYEEYRKLVPATLAQYGGKYLVRGGDYEVLEGDWQPRRLVVLEFASVEQAKRWYDSPEYRDSKALRLATAHSNVILVPGTNP